MSSPASSAQCVYEAHGSSFESLALGRSLNQQVVEVYQGVGPVKGVEMVWEGVGEQPGCAVCHRGQRWLRRCSSEGPDSCLQNLLRRRRRTAASPGFF